MALADLARQIGADADPHRAEAERIAAALVDELYVIDAGHGLFHAHDQRAGRRLPERTVGGLLPLVLAELPASIVDAVLATLTGPVFRAGARDVLGVPSFDLTAPEFDAQRYWRGPSWLNTTWMVGRGLQAHGRHELAAQLLDDMVSLSQRSGFQEYFNPHTGRGHGTDQFSWSAALTLDVLAEA